VTTADGTPGGGPGGAGAGAAPLQEPIALYRWMAISRALDRALCAANPKWFPSEGEEATIVGSFFDLRPGDVAAPHYRDPFVVSLMRGAEAWRLAAQVLGKPAGYNRGRSVPFTGPMERNIVPWVAGDLGTSIGVATGAALALQRAGGGGVAVCAFGDGTANRGDVHENLNLAAVWRLPIVYVCQNNGWSISERAADYLPAPVVDRAAGYGIPGMAVDGQDVEAVRAAVRAGIERARAGDGPSLVEARTVRARGHWAGDVAQYLTDEERGAAWSDPLEVQAERVMAAGLATEADLARIRKEAAAEAEAALAAAKAEPDAGPGDLGGGDVYA